MNPRLHGWHQPLGLALPMTMATFALGIRAAGAATPMWLAGAAAGAAWCALLAYLIARLGERPTRLLANAAIGLAITATGVALGGGLMYAAIAGELLRQPTTDPGSLSAVMRPAVPFFIVVNTAMEALLVPVLLFANWESPRRRPFILAGTVTFFVFRVWSYLTYVPRRLATAAKALSPEDIEWFRTTLAVDYRGVLVAAVLGCLIVAALMPSTNSLDL